MELLIVVSIILTLSAIAIPNLQRARIAANEASTVGSLRAIITAQYAYSTAYTTFASQLGYLSENHWPCAPTPTGACIIDSALAGATPGHGSHSGYVFLVTGTNNGYAFVVAASPKVVARTGNNNFCASTDGTLRSEPATAGDQPVTTQQQCTLFAPLGGSGTGHSHGDGGDGGDDGGGEGGGGEGGGGEGEGGHGH